MHLSTFQPDNTQSYHIIQTIQVIYRHEIYPFYTNSSLSSFSIIY